MDNNKKRNKSSSKSVIALVLCLALLLSLVGGGTFAYMTLLKDDNVESEEIRQLRQATTARGIEEYLAAYASERYGYNVGTLENMDYQPYVDAIASYYREGGFDNIKLSAGTANDYEVVSLVQKDIEKYMTDHGVSGDMDPTLLQDLINISIAEQTKDDPDYSNLIDSIRDTYDAKFSQINNSLDTLREQYNTLQANLDAGVSVTDTKVIEQSVIEVTNSLVDVQRKIEQIQAVQNTLTGASGGVVSGADPKRVEQLEKQVIELGTQLTNTHTSVADDMRKLQDAFGKDLTSIYEQLNKQSDNSLTIIQQLIKETGSDASQDTENAKKDLTNAIDQNKNETDKVIADNKTEINNKVDQNKQETDKLIADNNTAINNKVDQNKAESDKALSDTKNELTDTINQNQEATNKELQNQQNLIDQNKADTDQQIADNKANTDAQIEKNKQETNTILQNQQNLIDTNKAATDALIASNKADTDQQIAQNKADTDETLKNQQNLIDQNKADTDQQIADNKAELTAKLDSDISDLDQKVTDQLIGQQTTIQNVYNDLSTAIGNAGNRIDITMNDIQNLQQTANSLNNKDLQLQNNIDATKIELTQNITNVSNSITTACNNVKTELKQDINGLQSSVNNLASATNNNTNAINEAVNNINTANGNITNINNNLTSYMNSTNTTLSNLQTSVGNAQSKADSAYSLADSANSVASAAKSAADDAASKVNGLTSTVNDLSSKITQEISDRQSADATLTESVNSLKSDLSSLKEEVASGKIKVATLNFDHKTDANGWYIYGINGTVNNADCALYFIPSELRGKQIIDVSILRYGSKVNHTQGDYFLWTSVDYTALIYYGTHVALAMTNTALSKEGYPAKIDVLYLD